MGKLPLTLMEAMGNYFASNPCLGQGDMRANITLEALQRTEQADHWTINRKKLSRADVMELTLDLVASGFSLPAILATTGMPKNRTIMSWLNEYRPYAELMEVAENMRAIILSEQALDIIDAPDPTGKQAFRDKSRAELRMRLAESLHPRKYGKKTQVDVNHRLDDLSSPEVWSRFASVLTVHASMIEAQTGIKILVPAEVRDAEVVRPTQDEEEQDIQAIGMEGAPPDDDWNNDLHF